MSKKTFFCNINKTESHKLRLINKEIMPKSFIREVLPENKNIKIIDNSYSINDILLKNKKKRNKKKIGSTIKVNNSILKNKFWHMIQLAIPTLANEKSKNFAINFVKNFSLFLKKQKVLVSILETKKGGFIARSFGILGFLPLKQYLSINKNLCQNTKVAKLKELPKIKTIAHYYFLKTCKLAIKLKTPLIANKKKWRFLTKATFWFKKIKKHKKKHKKHKKKIWKTKKLQYIKTKAKKKFKYKKCPFVFYNINKYKMLKNI